MDKFNNWTQLSYIKEIKGNEFKALMVIIDRYNMKCDGVWNNTPQCFIQDALDLSRKGIYKIIKNLEDKGFIHTSTNVHHSADDIVPNIEHINELINTYEYKSTPTPKEIVPNIEHINTYEYKSTPTYEYKSTPKPKVINLKKKGLINYNNSTCKDHVINNYLSTINSINPVTGNTGENELSTTQDRGTSSSPSSSTGGHTEVNHNTPQGEGWQSPYSGSTILTQGIHCSLGTLPTTTDDVIAEFDALFNGSEDNSNAEQNTPNHSKPQINDAGEPNSNAVEQLPTDKEKHAQNASKCPYTQSDTPMGNLTSEDIRKIQITDFKTDYNTNKAKLWNGAKFKHLVIAAVEHTNHLLFENGERFSTIACGAYLHGKATLKTLKGEMTETQSKRLHIALTELGTNIKKLGCGDNLKTLQLGCDEFEYTLQYYKI